MLVPHWVFRSSLLLAVAASVCRPYLVHAQGNATAASDAEALKRAREQFSQSLALQTGGDWAGALALLKEVAAVKSTPQVRFNIALCEEHLGRLVAALGDYELAASDAESEKAEQVREEVDSRLEPLRARVPRAIVRRGSNADAATISLDGVALGDSVLNGPLPLDPGPHWVEAKAAGFRPFKQTFRVAEQQSLTVEVVLEPEASAVVSPPRAPTPLAHPSGMRTAGFIVGGVGVASLIGSGVFFYLRHDAIADLDAECGSARTACPESSRDQVSRGKAYATLADVTLITGALGVGLGAALVIIGGHSSEQPSVAIAPSASGANRAGASLIGRF